LKNRRCLVLLGALLAAGTLLAADAPPPSDAPAQPPPKHKLGGGFKGQPIEPGPAPGQKRTPAANPAPPPAAGKTPRIVIDNKLVRKTEGADSGTRKATAPPPPSAPPPAAQPAPVTMPKILDLQGHDEAYWREKAAATRDAVQKARDALAAAEAEEKREENDFYAWDDGQYRDNVIKPAWDRAKEETIKARGDLDAAQKRLDELEDEARRAGAYPGWIR